MPAIPPPITAAWARWHRSSTDIGGAPASAISPNRFLATHVNRNPALWSQAQSFAKEGGGIEITSQIQKDRGYGNAIEPEEAAIDDIGITVTSITDQMRAQFTLPDDLRGVVITGVEADSAAAEKSLRPGDVIVEVSQEEVSTPGQIAEKIREARDADRSSVLLKINRNGDRRFVAVRIKKS